jgi:hypothetical protein
MSYTIANYTFLPWLRQGIANKITTADNDPGVKIRAAIKVDFSLETTAIDGAPTSEPFSKDVQLYGPGDIIGIDLKSIVKNDPKNWITNFEPNYLPYVEFYDEDFPWRYTPAMPKDDRLRPWITLVVIKDGEFEEAKNIQGKPLSFISVKNAWDKFPPAEQLWAWAHVHVSQSLMDAEKKIVETDTNKTITAFQTLINKNPDEASSRILCPMKLENNTAYHAFVIPTFETGRLAGLGLEPLPAMPHATFSAWDKTVYTGKQEPDNFPVYHRWFFRTGDVGDFEYLVRLLKPKPIDKRVGRRDIDVQFPGSNIDGIKNPELEGILKLGGALKVPFDTMSDADQADVKKYEDWDQSGYPQLFQKDLAAFINLSDDYTQTTSAIANAETNLHPDIKINPDPLITAPLYGRWHALTERLLTQRDTTDVPLNKNWVHQLNLDPTWRVTAGYGTRVIQENQETYMEAAWAQVGEILEANRKIRLSQFAKIVSQSWYHNQIAPIIKASAEKGLLLMSPVYKRIIHDGITVHHHIDRSIITRSVTSPSMRKLLRPGGRIIKKSAFKETVMPTNLIGRINEGEIVIAPPKVISPNIPTTDQVADQMIPKDIPPFLIDLMHKSPWIKWMILALIILLFLIIFSGGLSIAALTFLALIAGGLVLLFNNINKWEKSIQSAGSVAEVNQTPESVDQFPKSSDFVISSPGQGFTPTIGTTDSAEAIIYKSALKDSLGMIQMARELGKIEVKNKINISATVDASFKALDPAVTIPKMVFNGLFIPERIRNIMVEDFAEIKAYPKIHLPMYCPLKEISKQYFLPNLNYISQNTISLMETNQKFIEAYMVGLNHEFSRELLWREYPTDQRGSYFRQFWDVSGYFDDKNRSEEQLQEDLKDIPEIHLWKKDSELEDHDNREEGGDNEEEVVLVIRGELLKKYPNAVIYAQKAEWEIKDGKINNKVERQLVKLEGAEANKPPRNKLKTPLYEARVEPDLYFFGFDLTIVDALGGTGETQADINKPGWFFCIKERPGEPRFGLDIDQDNEKPEVWNDLSWNDVLPANAPVLPDNELASSFIPVGEDDILEQDLSANPLEADDSEKIEQLEDDKNISWKKNMNAADVAYVLYQVPVLMAVHAVEMLPPQKPSNP